MSDTEEKIVNEVNEQETTDVVVSDSEESKTIVKEGPETLTTKEEKEEEEQAEENEVAGDGEVDSKNTEEEERLKKLEEARKKVEALRNKKKGKKNKKKESTPVPVESSEELKKESKEESEHGSKEEVKEEPKEEIKEEPKEEVKDDIDELFGNDTAGDTASGVENTDSYLDTIQKEQASLELENYKAKVEELEKEVKRLKFVNMEHETTIDDLHDEVSDLKLKLSVTEKKLQEAQASAVQSQSRPLTPASSSVQLSTFGYQQQQQQQQQQHPVQQQAGSAADRYSPYAPQQAAFNQHGVPPTQSPVQPVDQELLHAKWKDWHVDMTSWRSIGTGPIVQF